MLPCYACASGYQSITVAPGAKHLLVQYLLPSKPDLVFVINLMEEQLTSGRFSDRQRKIICCAVFTWSADCRTTWKRMRRSIVKQYLEMHSSSAGFCREERVFRDSEENILKELRVRLIMDKVPGTDELMKMATSRSPNAPPSILTCCTENTTGRRQRFMPNMAQTNPF